LPRHDLATQSIIRESGPVFVVDDDRGLLRLVEKALEREGFETITASSGKAAIAWLAENQPGLMLLDLKLEDYEGKELIQRLEDTRRCPPFIIITGQGDERVAVEMMKRGALDYLVKDVDFLQFVPAVVRRSIAQLQKERRLHELEREILEISDRERERLGQDLHDGLCQHLAGIELMSQVLQQRLAGKSKSEASRAGEIARLVREAISQTRMLARGLSPMILESEGLASGLEELAIGTHKMFGIRCRFECSIPIHITDQSVATHLYRIAQEAVSNAYKHGRAKEVVVTLLKESENVVLTIADNGCGLPPTWEDKKGMGLHIMQYRAGRIGGSIRLEKNQTGGVTVSCIAPVGRWEGVLHPSPTRNAVTKH
jgi:signal transduction histidine kinase